MNGGDGDKKSVGDDGTNAPEGADSFHLGLFVCDDNEHFVGSS